MPQNHPGPDHDRLLGTRLDGIATQDAPGGGLTGAEKTACAADLREVADGRGDLLAEAAGLVLGTAEGRGNEYRAQAQAIAELWRMAGT